MPKPKKFQLQIPEPCQQPWTEMELVPGGRFCANCQYVVRDFTGHTDVELSRIFSRADAPHCGRFLKRQLGMDLQVVSPPGRRWWPRMAVGAFMVMAAMPHALLAQAPQVVQVDEGLAASNPSITGPQGGKPYRLTGTVVCSETGMALDGVSLNVAVLDVKVFTDSQGRFTLEFDSASMPEQVLILIDDFRGLEPLELFVKKSELPLDVVIGFNVKDLFGGPILVGALAKSPSIQDLQLSIELIRPQSKKKRRAKSL